MQSFILEFILTFFLMLVIINVATGGKEQGMFAGLAIGSTVLLEAMFAGPCFRCKYEPGKIYFTSHCFRSFRTSMDLYSRTNSRSIICYSGI
jgi:hypothetical protein